jgi:CheY-like chemotaxis protein
MHVLDPSVHIMLVEDDEVDIQDIKRTFQKNNILNPIQVATNGLEALNKLHGLNGEKKLDPMPKIFLIDINMPRMNGVEFLQALRENPITQGALVFILTSSNNDRDKIAAYNLNIAGYILKPLQFSDFIQTIATLNRYWALLEFPRDNNSIP